jgi:hypothetical protein
VRVCRRVRGRGFRLVARLSSAGTDRAGFHHQLGAQILNQSRPRLSHPRPH